MMLVPEETVTITIEPPEVMAVFSEAHPRPAHAIQGSTAVAKAFAALKRPDPRQRAEE
mgnify:FL=1